MKVKYKQTGQIYDMPDNATVDTSVFEPVNGQVQQQTTQNAPAYITGHSPQEHIAALNAARANKDTAAEADIMSNYTMEIQHQKDIASGAFKTQEEKLKTTAVADKQKAIDLKDKMMNELKTKAQAVQNIIEMGKSGKLSGEQYRTALGQAASDFNKQALFAKEDKVAGSALTAIELAQLGGGIIGINSRTPNLLDKALGNNPAPNPQIQDPEDIIAQKMNYIITGKPPSGNKGGGGDINWAGDAKDIINGILGMPKGLMDWQTNKMKQGQVGQLPDLIGEMLMGYGKNLNKDIGQPLQGGDIVGRAGENLKQRPISTVLDVLPFLGAGKMLRKAPVVSDAGGASEVAKSVTVPPATNPLTKILNKVQESAKGEAATNVGVADGTNVTRSEALMGDALKMTKSLTTRGLAKELEAFGPKANQAIDAWTKSHDKVIGLQPIDEFLATTKERLLQSPSGIADPSLVDKVMISLEKQIKTGNIKGMHGDINPATNLTTINEARKTINSSLRSWHKANKPTASVTDNVNALKWEAADELKNFMGEASGNDKLKELIYKQHVALETAPELAKQALSKVKDRTFWQAAYDKLTSPIKKAAEPVRIGGARALQGGNGEDLVQQILNEANTVKPNPQVPPSSTIPKGPSATNMKYIQDILDKAKNAKSGPSLRQNTIERDMRYKQGTWIPKK